MHFDIAVSREEFDLALKQVKKHHKGKKPFNIILRFDGSALLVDTPVATFPVCGSGSADIGVVLPGRMMILIKGTFPAIDVLTFRLEGGCSLKIGSLTFPCGVLCD